MRGKRQRWSTWRLILDKWWILNYLKWNSGFKIFRGQATLTYDSLTWSNEGVAATPCWVLPHPTTYAYCPTKCCLGIKIQPLPFWWNPWSHEMLLGSKQSWWTLEDEDSPKARKTNRNNVLLEDNVSSESKEEFLFKQIKSLVNLTLTLKSTSPRIWQINITKMDLFEMRCWGLLIWQ